MGSDQSATGRGARKMTYRDAASLLLKEHGPMHYQALSDAIVKADLVQSSGATPAASLNATIAVEIKRKGKDSVFIRIRPGVFGLRGLHEPATRVSSTPTPGTTDHENGEPDAARDESDLRVRTPLFPVYSQLRHLLRVWPGHPRKQITGLHGALQELRGTPQKTVDWTDPRTWIPERLRGADRVLAHDIWERSNGTVNPRHTYGHWLLAQRYDLVHGDGDGTLEITEAGREFLDQPGGETECAIDEA